MAGEGKLSTEHLREALPIGQLVSSRNGNRVAATLLRPLGAKLRHMNHIDELLQELERKEDVELVTEEAGSSNRQSYIVITGVRRLR